MATLLSWKEIAQICQDLKLGGLFLERVIVPERLHFPTQYLKGELCFRFTGRKDECFLVVSLRAQHPYLAYGKGKGPKASLKAPRSGFDLSIGKALKGSKVLKIEAHFEERAFSLWFEEGMRLSFFLIPSTPEGFLVKETRENQIKVIASSRGRTSLFPKPGLAPREVNFREKVLENPLKWFSEELDQEAFENRLALVKKALTQKRLYAESRSTQCEEVLKKASQEEDWKAWGEKFKADLGTEVKSPHFPELTLSQSVQKYFHLAKRKENRLRETRLRLESFRELLKDTRNKLNTLPDDWQKLKLLEASLENFPQVDIEKEVSSKSSSSYSHKSFLSKDQQLIWVGRSKLENLELTFKQARGNDLWMHVKGKPGAHVVLSLPSGKSASLESLLDAAQIALHYSGGDHWGKTEIDYTFRKYVKRIKNSTEVSYSQNKTLVIEPEPERLRRLLSQTSF